MTVNRPRIKVSFPGVAMLALLAGAAAAQVPVTMPDRGIVPAGTYAPTNVDTVSATSGNVLVKIPLAKLPPGRAGWSSGLGLVYNSNIYDLSNSYTQLPLFTGSSQIVLEQ